MDVHYTCVYRSCNEELINDLLGQANSMQGVVTTSQTLDSLDS